MKTKIWMDCDPGIDDAVAIAMIASSLDHFDLLGISTVAGNMNSHIVNHNARGLVKLLNLKDVMVVKGANEPLLQPLEDASAVHGQTGLGTVKLTYDPDLQVYSLLDMYQRIIKEDKIVLIATGPLTNVALLFKTFPDIQEHIEKLVIMGGSTISGNVTKYAEFNIYTDPHSAKIVFNTDIPIQLCPLDVTSAYGIEQHHIYRLLNNPKTVANTYGQMLDGLFKADFYEGCPYVCVHDASTIMSMLYPDNYAGKQVGLDVILEGEHTGQTVINPDKHNIYLINQVIHSEMMIEQILKNIESL